MDALGLDGTHRLDIVLMQLVKLVRDGEVVRMSKRTGKAISLTDLLDGKIARKYNLVTNFGKFMDPLADKMLVCSALICLTALDKLPAWITIVIICRDFVISGFRLVAADNGVVIAASYWGKYKTTFQMIMVCLLIADLAPLALVTTIVTWIAVILTIVSLVDYLVKNRSVLMEDKK